MTEFIPGLELSKSFYKEAVKPILETQFSGLRYSAASIGYGSDVLGFDTPVSTDHEWGPRLLLFLSEEDFELFIKWTRTIQGDYRSNLNLFVYFVSGEVCHKV